MEDTYPSNWNKGFQYPIEIAGGGTEEPFLQNGKWHVRVFDKEKKKHFLYSYADDAFYPDDHGISDHLEGDYEDRTHTEEDAEQSFSVDKNIISDIQKAQKRFRQGFHLAKSGYRDDILSLYAIHRNFDNKSFIWITNFTDDKGEPIPEKRLFKILKKVGFDSMIELVPDEYGTNNEEDNEQTGETPQSNPIISKTNEWELRRQETNRNKWQRRRERWAEWKKNNPEKARLHAIEKAKHLR